MKTINRFLYIPILTMAVLLALWGCKENTLVFPGQVELEEGEESNRGPVKQSDLTVTIENDESIKFDLSTVDTERVAAVFFSHNNAGEKVTTEITDFAELYIIDNLPLTSITDIEVWAVGHNDIVSNVYTYKVKPLPYPAKLVAETFSIEGGVLSAKIDVYNTTNADATFYYKVDDAPAYTVRNLPTPTTDLDIVISDLTVGVHVLSYYFTDVNGGQSEVQQASFVSIAPVESFTTAASKALWKVSVSSNQEGDGGGGPALIDGNSETFWHTPWSGNIPAWPHEATIDLGEQISLTKFIFLNRHNNGGNAPRDIDLQVSTDGMNFTTHQSFMNTNTVAGATVSFDITTPVSTRYVRISCKTGYNASWVNFGEISFEGRRE